MVAKETKFAKETKVAKEVIVISSSDDEVSGDDAVSSDEELTSHEVSCDDEVSSEEEVTVIASSKGSYKSLLKWYDDSSDEDIHEYYFVILKALNSKVSTSSASKAFASKASKTSKSDISFDETPSSDTSSYGSSSDETYYDDSAKKQKTTNRKGPIKELLKWYDDTTDENIAKFKVAAKSKETGNWSLCRDRFIYYNFAHFASAIYWNDAFHWLENENRNFLQSFGGSDGSDNPMLVLIDIPDILHLYLVNTDEFMTLLPERWSIRSTVWSIGLGEREKDSFLVINLSGKVVKYNLISKTIIQIFVIGSNEMDDDDDYEFIPTYTIAHHLYEFISSFSSV
ncbi:hypothetical protein Tco_0516329 [Tanacetum coccineum]